MDLGRVASASLPVSNGLLTHSHTSSHLFLGQARLLPQREQVQTKTVVFDSQKRDARKEHPFTPHVECRLPFIELGGTISALLKELKRLVVMRQSMARLY